MSAEDRHPGSAEVLRISLEDLAEAAPPALAVPPQATAKSYGNIHEPADPTILTQEKGSIFLKAWVYLGIAGFFGALLGWGCAEPWFVDGQGFRWGNLLLLPIIVAVMCIGFAVAESIVERSWRKGLIRVGIAIPLGFALGLFFNFVANILYRIGLGIGAAAGMQTNHNPAWWIIRGFAWAVFGVAGGIVYGIIGRSARKIGYGALGGAIGAMIGGMVFDPISFAVTKYNGHESGSVSRAVGFTLLGMATGIAMGLVESALKDRWLYVTAGPLAGKQFILYKPVTVMGSAQTSDIYLFKDLEILPAHATLAQKGDRVYVNAEGPVYMAGSRIYNSRMLENGAILQIGRYSFRYQEKPRG
jgi:hypothetical protein